MKFLPTFFTLLITCSVQAQSIDVTHYKFQLEVSDRSDSIYGEATIHFSYLRPASAISFNLQQSTNGKGMTISSVTLSGKAAPFEQKNNAVIITSTSSKDSTGTAVIKYSGIPTDGLIISKNKFGKRTFFSDNWPDRAAKWIPCVDEPRDKSPVTFVVIAPSHYQVISNGLLTGRTDLPGQRSRTEWTETIPLPTKIMVVGIAEFATEQSGMVGNIPVTTWVFPENKAIGFGDYGIAPPILKWLQDYIGPFPYKKLAHVQSRTMYGGMENGSAIFYAENSVNGLRNKEELIAHETAHQYFGDMVTERNFAHVWLSEGFATYMAHLYIESRYGKDSLAAEMQIDRNKVIAFSRSNKLPMIDSVSPLMERLNPNSYEKGSWLLHMLRNQTGDSTFRKVIRQYYATYAGRNVLSADLQAVFEKFTGKSFQSFFDQWLYTPGQPDLDIQWRYNATGRNIEITITQLQEKPFNFTLPFNIVRGTNSPTYISTQVTRKVETFRIPVKERPDALVADPRITLLYSGKVTAKN